MLRVRSRRLRSGAECKVEGGRESASESVDDIVSVNVSMSMSGHQCQ